MEQEKAACYRTKMIFYLFISLASMERPAGRCAVSARTIEKKIDNQPTRGLSGATTWCIIHCVSFRSLLGTTLSLTKKNEAD
jgi:hypothetical protein